PPSPRLVSVPGAAGALDRVADTLDDLVRLLLGELRVQQQHDFVLVHARIPLPTVSVGPVSWAPLRDGRRDGQGEKPRQCSIEPVKRLLALLAGGLGLGALLRRRRSAPAPVSSPADELRLRLAESRGEGSEEPPPQDEPADAEARRADVHARARNAIDELRD